MAGDAGVARIAEKIRKLLALAEGEGTTPAEAAAAAARAAELMERYRIDQATLTDHVDPETPHYDDQPLARMPKRRAWATLLVCLLGKLNGCAVVAETERRRIDRRQVGPVSLRLVGRSSDMQVVRYLYTYLEREIERLYDKQLASGMPKRWGPAYKLGAAEAVYLRLEQAQKAARKGAPSTAIVLVDQRLADADRVLGEIPEHRMKGRVDKAAEKARAVGQRHGYAIPLHDGMEGNAPPPQITAAKPQGETDGKQQET